MLSLSLAHCLSPSHSLHIDTQRDEIYLPLAFETVRGIATAATSQKSGFGNFKSSAKTPIPKAVFMESDPQNSTNSPSRTLPQTQFAIRFVIGSICLGFCRDNGGWASFSSVRRTASRRSFQPLPIVYCMPNPILCTVSALYAYWTIARSCI